MFLRDAEQIDSVTSAHEAFLANDDLGVSQSHIPIHNYNVCIVLINRLSV